ncbi:hypothetical protein [Methylococcus sp. EFPC2]|uniref:hypothetical protein n=1 Tax=Methylococcus sp. EFPC2 TaxID=2812648 RepID=UPI001967FF75|nr:hypothetical protein [Methylococcus sp. EFPC2]QSA96786.1 hypothetical protein JWZ97_16500 [Methylococcus sp. EFPC2]
MSKLNDQNLERWEAKRDLNAELEASIIDIQKGRITTYTVYQAPPTDPLSSSDQDDLCE